MAQWRSPWILLKTIARMLSFPSLEVGSFVGTGADRVVFAQQHWTVVPLLLVVSIVGFAQPVWMFVTWFRRSSPVARDWPAVRWLFAATVAPVAFAFAAYCWTFVDSPRARRLAAAAMAINIAFQFGVAWTRLPERSLYEDRPIVAAAIAAKKPDLFGHRRYFGKGLSADQVVPPEVMAQAPAYLEVLHASWARGTFRVSHWSIAVRNRSTEAGYRDLVYETTYYDAGGKAVVIQSDRIEIVLQPGESRNAESVDGLIPASVVRAALRLVRAEPLRPLLRGFVAPAPDHESELRAPDPTPGHMG